MASDIPPGGSRQPRPGQPDAATVGALQAALQAGDLSAAATQIADIHATHPDFVPAMTLGMKVALARSDRDLAAHYAARWVASPALSGTDLYNAGVALKTSGLFQLAVTAYTRAVAKGVPDAHEAHNNMGVIQADALQDRAAALASFDAALALRPDFDAAYINRGNLFEEFGDFDGAVHNYTAAITHAPPAYECLARLGHCQTIAGADDPLIARLEAGLNSADANPLERESLAYALGHIWDGLEDYAQAFGAFTQANVLGNSYMPAYDRARETAKFDAVKAAFPASVFNPPAPPQSTAQTGAAPIFICGLFRSGSTLFEQIISGHAAVTPCGEIDFFDTLTRRDDFALPQGRALDADAVAAWRKAYRDTPLVRAVETPFFTDKRPDNLLYLGIIKQLFPQAKIVITQRAARDNAVSLYFTQFGPGQSYARDLSTIAHYQALVAGLTDHWQDCFGDDIVLADYDAFVRAPEPTARHIMEGLGLTWDKDCLNFHTRRNRVKTASYKQVRQKLYTSSSGRAANYDFAFKD